LPHRGLCAAKRAKPGREPFAPRCAALIAPRFSEKFLCPATAHGHLVLPVFGRSLPVDGPHINATHVPLNRQIAGQPFRYHSENVVGWQHRPQAASTGLAGRHLPAEGAFVYHAYARPLKRRGGLLLFVLTQKATKKVKSTGGFFAAQGPLRRKTGKTRAGTFRPTLRSAHWPVLQRKVPMPCNRTWPTGFARFRPKLAC
jgi:hypothetical protein